MDNAILTVKEMIKVRNYTLESEIDLEDEYRILCKNENDEIVSFIFYKLLKINKDVSKNLIKELNSLNIHHCIIICNIDNTHSSKQLLNEIPTIHFEFFKFNELQINITKHKLVPKHIKLEGKELLENKKLYTNTQLPKLLKTDPISRFYNYQKGDRIKILRNNDEIYYRIVI